MRIGFDATSIHGHGGLKTYARELIRALAIEFPEDGIHLLTTFDSRKKDRLASFFGDLPNVTVSSSIPHALLLGRGLLPLTRILSGILWRGRRNTLDVVHITDPFGAAVLPFRPVCTVHDLFPLTREEYRGTELERMYRRRTPIVLGSSAAVITPSEYVRRQIRDLFPNAAVPIFTVPEAASEIYAPGSGQSCDPGHGLGKDGFFLFVGRNDRRKNIPGLIEAYGMLEPGTRERVGLVLVTPGGPGSLTDIGIGTTDPSVSPVMLEGLTEHQLRDLYRTACALVFPSMDEGFGLPVLEAMACGCPVITSAASCLPEVAGDAAMLVDPHDTPALAEAMEKLAGSQELRRDLSGRGLLRSGEFSWSRTARETMAIYRDAAS